MKTNTLNRLIEKEKGTKTITIFMVKNYSQLIRIPNNREISRTNVENKIESINEIGLLEERPVIIDRNLFEKLNAGKTKFSELVFPIVDGQHLSVACEKLGYPVPCTISSSLNSDTDTIIRRLNQAQKAWGPNDFVNQRPDLVKQINYLKQNYPVLSKASVGSILTIISGCFSITDLIKRGIKDLPKCDYVPQILHTIDSLTIDGRMKKGFNVVFPIVKMYQLYYENYKPLFSKIDWNLPFKHQIMGVERKALDKAASFAIYEALLLNLNKNVVLVKKKYDYENIK